MSLKRNMKVAHQNHLRKMKGKFMVVIVSNKWRNIRMKFGSTREIINRNHIRKHLNFYTILKHDALRKKCLNYLKPFIINNVSVEYLRDKILKVHK